MDSDFEPISSSPSQQDLPDTQPIEEIAVERALTSSTDPFRSSLPRTPAPIRNKASIDRYNEPDYQLEESTMYIFKEGLFTRTLLPIKDNEDRTMLISCTL